jgi:tetratricopeptide (TPR) repeat protein
MRSLTSVVVVVCVFSGSGPARAADPGQEQASALNDQGNAAFDLGNYDEAVDKFTEAYKAYPDARILYNLAQSYRKKKDYERALQVYQNYIRNLPNSANRKTVEDLIVELDGLIARQKATSERPPQGTTSTAPQVPPIITKIEEPRPWYV